MPVIQREVRKRGIFGHLIKWLFIGWNLFMALWLFSALSQPSASLMVGIFAGYFLIAFWAAGSIVLGILVMLTRGQKFLITED